MMGHFNESIYLQVFAYEESEKYKEGKFIIERFYLAKKTEAKVDKDSPDFQYSDDETMNNNSEDENEEDSSPLMQQINSNSPWGSNPPASGTEIRRRFSSA